jgi:hypothetical protein
MDSSYFVSIFIIGIEYEFRSITRKATRVAKPNPCVKKKHSDGWYGRPEESSTWEKDRWRWLLVSGRLCPDVPG